MFQRNFRLPTGKAGTFDLRPFCTQWNLYDRFKISLEENGPMGRDSGHTWTWDHYLLWLSRDAFFCSSAVNRAKAWNNRCKCHSRLDDNPIPCPVEIPPIQIV